MYKVIVFLSKLNKLPIYLGHIAIFIIFIWIGGLKFFGYEARGIVPFVANSPAGILYKDASNYKSYMFKEGSMDLDKNIWHKSNHTYLISYILGVLIISFGSLVLLGIFYPTLGLIGGVLVFLMSFVTTSFLFTTPEVWVPNLGAENFGFPFLSGAGRLVIKDLALMALGLIVASSCAKRILNKKL